MAKSVYQVVRILAPSGEEQVVNVATSKAAARKALTAARREKPGLLHRVVRPGAPPVTRPAATRKPDIRAQVARSTRVGTGALTVSVQYLQDAQRPKGLYVVGLSVTLYQGRQAWFTTTHNLTVGFSTFAEAAAHVLKHFGVGLDDTDARWIDEARAVKEELSVERRAERRLPGSVVVAPAETGFMARRQPMSDDAPGEGDDP